MILPDFIPDWRKQAEHELEKIIYERKFDPWTKAQKTKILELADRGGKLPLANVISRSEAVLDMSPESFCSMLIRTKVRKLGSSHDFYIAESFR